MGHIFINFGLKMFQYVRRRNVSILPYFILPTHTFKTLQQKLYLFLFSSDKHQSNHFLGFQAISINYSLIIFKCFVLFKFNMLDKEAILIRTIKENLRNLVCFISFYSMIFTLNPIYQMSETLLI